MRSPPRGATIHEVRIEAPSSNAAEQLVHDLVGFVRTDVFPLEDERWEVRVDGSSDEELDVVLHRVARWATDCRLDAPQVLVDDEPVEL